MNQETEMVPDPVLRANRNALLYQPVDAALYSAHDGNTGFGLSRDMLSTGIWSPTHVSIPRVGDSVSYPLSPAQRQGFGPSTPFPTWESRPPVLRSCSQWGFGHTSGLISTMEKVFGHLIRQWGTVNNLHR